jgi:hypothetical protein
VFHQARPGSPPNWAYRKPDSLPAGRRNHTTSATLRTLHSPSSVPCGLRPGPCPCRKAGEPRQAPPCRDGLLPYRDNLSKQVWNSRQPVQSAR